MQNCKGLNKINNHTVVYGWELGVKANIKVLILVHLIKTTWTYGIKKNLITKETFPISTSMNYSN